jgi:hypothetical protein
MILHTVLSPVRIEDRPEASFMEWIVGIVVAVVIAAALGWRWGGSGVRKGTRKRIPSKEDLEVEIRRIEGETEEAAKRGDEAAVEELTLQLRVRRHWLNKLQDGRWKEYYRARGEKHLDEWGKSGAK